MSGRRPIRGGVSFRQCRNCTVDWLGLRRTKSYEARMLLEGVYYNNNGGYRRPGEAVVHLESRCADMKRFGSEMEWVRDRTGLPICHECRRLGEERAASRR